MENNYPRHHRRPEQDAKKGSQMLRLRNVLNIIFMLGAIIGLAFYFFVNQTTGTIIILVAMAFKLIESALRFIYR